MTKKSNWILPIGLVAGAALVALINESQRQAARLQWQNGLETRRFRTALVTGASSGIGRAYAQSLAQRGYRLVLVARGTQRLNELADDLKARYNTLCEVISADLSCSEGIERVEARIQAPNEIDFLVNNAGYDIYAPFVEIPSEKTVGMINCMLLASVRLTRAALPFMIKRGCGAVVNVSSAAAFLVNPKDSTYVASKAYINAFSESLALEMAPYGIRFQALCPGFTLSGFHDTPELAEFQMHERIPRWLWMTPEAVVKASLKGLAENRYVVIPGIHNRIIAAAGRLGLVSAALKIRAAVSNR